MERRDLLHRAEALSGFLMSDDGGPSSVYPRIAICVIEVPVGVDEVPERISAGPIQSLADLLLRGCVTRVDQDLSVRSREYDNVAASSHQHTHVTAERLAPNDNCGPIVVWGSSGRRRYISTPAI
jgi:hypothetical protein